jgi:ABC-type sugar transport system ATPase subunit
MGHKVRIRKPGDAKEYGIIYVPEDRKNHGILSILSIGENIILANAEKVTAMPLSTFRPGKVRELISKVLENVRVKFSNVAQRMDSLSGGNQQKIVLGKWIVANPRILLLDEPTRGIDVGAKAEIYNYISNLASEGTAIILFSSEITEIVGLCHRVLILYKGKFIKELTSDQITKETVLYYAMGGKETERAS